MSDNVNDEEISLLDILAFVQESWKTISGVGLAGAALSAGLLTVIPGQYEAEALIEMAQLQSGGPISPTTVVIEAPALMIERLKNPRSYTSETTRACAEGDARFSDESLAALVKVSVPKGVNSVIKLQVRRFSPAAAEQCLTALIDMIRRQQIALLKPRLDEMRATLTFLQNRLEANRAAMMQSDKANLSGVIFLAQRDESLYLMQQIDDLQRALASDFQTRQVSPVYAAPGQVSPKSVLTLALGVLGGLMLGLLLALVRRFLRQQRAGS